MPSTLLLIPLDDVVVFPTMDVTLPVDPGDEERVLLVPGSTASSPPSARSPASSSGSASPAAATARSSRARPAASPAPPRPAPAATSA